MKVEGCKVLASLEEERATGGAVPTKAGSKRPGRGQRKREPGPDEPPSGGVQKAGLRWKRPRGRGSEAEGEGREEERRGKRDRKRKWDETAPEEKQEVAEQGRRKASGAESPPTQGTDRPKAHKNRKQPENGEENEGFAPSGLRWSQP